MHVKVIGSAMRVLIIEDDQEAASYIAKALRESGHAADLAHDGESGLSMARDEGYDVLIVDRMLPRLDGLSIIRTLRDEGRDVPVLILSALGEVDDRVKGLKSGGDDYLTKPFAFSELLARVRVVLRRPQLQQSQIIEIEDLKIDLLKQKVQRAGKQISLTQKEFVLLSLLAQRTGYALSRTMIAEQVWDMNFDSDTNVVDVAIRRLRSKIDDPFSIKLIHTVRGVGYVLERKE